MAIATSTMMLISAGIQAIGAISQGNAARQQGDYNAAVERQRAERDREIAGQDEEDFRRETSRKFAQRRAALGASGVDASTGTPLLAADDFVTEEELQALRIRSGGNTSFIRGNQQAGLTSAAGRAGQRTGIFRAGSSLLTGFGTQFGKDPATTKPRRITGTQSTFALNT